MNNRTPLIAGNWEMHKTGAQAVDAASRLKILVASATGVEVMIAPTFTALYQVGQVLKESPIALAGQNLHWEPQGAFTGEISAQMLADVGCGQVIVGHSERHQFFVETNETVNMKIKTALSANLTPVLCIGESEAEREAGNTFSVLDKQVRDGLNGLVFGEQAEIFVAYEPVWAIGTGKTAAREQAQETHQFFSQKFYNNRKSRLGQKGMGNLDIFPFLYLLILILTYVSLLLMGRPVPDSLIQFVNASVFFACGYLAKSS
ncbi:hypothetical protein DSCO28_73490 (plasmid) [Desulfosarcina ovata subsp. sediminis]|uniref:Triosephosphate isomerase n=1 Tax=Desulfosarcina ovata subsp. sediminis TaxID=885957 RepID=A0A5K8A2K9_9BACT|nr:triose-phosphate isomerase [Desulfosarcina ovata]BBO86783.1 hypothetical protein DSCO28_73490 [Desulfosarcina ovata subsp. sediminis]